MSNTTISKTSNEPEKKKMPKQEPILFKVPEDVENPYRFAEELTANQKDVSEGLLCPDSPYSFEEYYDWIHPAPRVPQEKDALREARKGHGFGPIKRGWMKFAGFFSDETEQKRQRLDQKTKDEAKRIHSTDIKQYNHQYEAYCEKKKVDHNMFYSGDKSTVEKYYEWLIENDSYAVSIYGQFESEVLAIDYNQANKTLIVNYRLPNIEEISVFTHFQYNPENGHVEGYEMGISEQKRYRLNIARKAILRQVNRILITSNENRLIETVRFIGYLTYRLADKIYKVDVMIASFDLLTLHFNSMTDSIEGLFTNQVDTKVSANIYSVPPVQLTEVKWLKEEPSDEGTQKDNAVQKAGGNGC